MSEFWPYLVGIFCLFSLFDGYFAWRVEVWSCVRRCPQTSLKERLITIRDVIFIFIYYYYYLMTQHGT